MSWDRRLIIEQLDEQLKAFPKNRAIPRFRSGWIKTIRQALGMSARTLGSRIGVSQSQVSKLENSELDKAITLRSLERVAEGLDCELVYFLVPKSESLEMTLIKRAEQKATEDINRVNTHMALEGQGLGAVALQKMIDAEVQSLLYKQPRDFWDD